MTMAKTFNLSLGDALRSPLTSKADLRKIELESLIADRPKIAMTVRQEIKRRGGGDD